MSFQDQAIEVTSLVKKFDTVTAVDGISFAVAEGELFSFLGPNGAGKTTTISILCTLLKPTAGKAKVAGFDVLRNPWEVKRRIGVAPQETAISGRLSCWENLELIARAHGMNSQRARKRAEELLASMGLLERAKEPVYRFSGGMKRRLNLIMALVHDPPIIFLDEPTLGLDPQSRRAIWDYLEAMKGKKTIFLTTHYLEEADALSDRIAIIDEGKIVATGTPAELKRAVGGEKVVITCRFLGEAVKEELMRYKDKVEVQGNVIKAQDVDNLIPELLRLLVRHSVEILEFSRKEPSLDEVFLQFTGKELRE